MLTSTFPLVLLAALTQATGGQAKKNAPANADAVKQPAAERLALMKKSVSIYELVLASGLRGTASNAPVKAVLEPEPLLRWSDIHGNDDGAAVWSCPFRGSGRGVRATFFSCEYRP